MPVVAVVMIVRRGRGRLDTGRCVCVIVLMVMVVPVIVRMIVVAAGVVVPVVVVVVMVMHRDGFRLADGEPDRDGVDDGHDEESTAAEQRPGAELLHQHVIECAVVPHRHRDEGEGAADADGDELLAVEGAAVAVMMVVSHERSPKGGMFG